MVSTIRERETYDWRKVFSFHSKEDAGHEQPWFAYIQGENPDYPEQILRASLAQVYRRMEQVRRDETDPRDNHIHWWQQLNPVTTEALIQLTLGAPQMLYNGGLLLAPIRHFDPDSDRPGLPPDVAALVESVEGERVDLHLVNLSVLSERTVRVQAGTLGEHEFAQVTYDKIVSEYPGPVGDYATPEVVTGSETAQINDVYFDVALPPGTEIRLSLGLRRHVNPPSYAVSWG